MHQARGAWTRRAGTPLDAPESVGLAARLAQAPALEFLGVYCHAGHSYDCCGADEVRQRRPPWRMHVLSSL